MQKWSEACVPSWNIGRAPKCLRSTVQVALSRPTVPGVLEHVTPSRHEGARKCNGPWHPASEKVPVHKAPLHAPVRNIARSEMISWGVKHRGNIYIAEP